MAQLKEIIRDEDLKDVRVAIAKDVIARLNNKTITARKRHWLKARFPIINYRSEVKEVLEKELCDVCALGAIFYSAVVKYNELKFGEIWGNIERSLNEDSTHTFHSMSLDGIQYYLKDVFSEAQLMIIEAVFERGCGAFSEFSLQLSEEEMKKVVSFGEGITPEACMIKIMQNIIDNDGKFKI